MLKTNLGYAIPNSHFDINKIMNSGQLCLIYKINKNRYIVISELNYCIITVYGNCNFICCDNIRYWLNYFDLHTSYTKLLKGIDGSDKYLTSVIKYGQGLRICRRNLFEVMISFILSQNSNIPKIMSNIKMLCEEYGTKLYRNYYSFPTYSDLKNVSISDYENLGFGYRSKYVFEFVQNVNKNGMDSFKSGYDFQCISGIGPKVSSCIGLYGLHDFNYFPIDIHIDRILNREYPNGDFRYNMNNRGLIQLFMFYHELNHPVTDRINTDEIYSEDRDTIFLNRLCKDISKFEEAGLSKNQIKGALANSSYVKAYIGNPTFLYPAKDLPKGYKWNLGTKYHNPKTKKSDAETYVFLPIDDNLYIKGIRCVGTNVSDKDISYIKNYEELTVCKIFSKWDVSPFLHDCICDFWHKSGLKSGYIQPMLKNSYKVKCLDDGSLYYFSGFNPKEALEKMKYTLDLKGIDKDAKIIKHKKVWELQHSGKTYGCV